MIKGEKMKSLLKFMLLVLATLVYANAPGTVENEDRTPLLSVRDVSGLKTFDIWSGKYGLSTDGFGGYDNTEGNISAHIPSDATVEAAYLYATGVGTSGSVYNVNLAGTDVEFTEEDTWAGENYYTARKNVTDIITQARNNGVCDANNTCNFSIEELGYNDGEALVVIYSSDILPNSTIAILDGHAKMSGDTANLELSEALNKDKEGFFANIILGISYSYDDGSSYNQVSEVRINDQLLTSVAGGPDDGFANNGGLITVGSFDDPFTPANPTGPDDHEKYDISNLLVNGDTSIKIDTYNSSKDDNVFLSIFYMSEKTQNIQVDGGPMVTGTSLLEVESGSNVPVYYSITNHATSAIDINTTIEGNDEGWQVNVVNSDILNAHYDVNETKILQLRVYVPALAVNNSIKIKSVGNNIPAFAFTDLTIKQADNNTTCTQLTKADIENLSLGWHIVGTIEPISHDKFANLFSSVAIVWYWENGWKAYSTNSVIMERIIADENIGTLDAIEGKKGFWILKR
jgi:hypothetical protein